MHRIAPAEKDTDNAALERGLWDAAGQVRANSGLKSLEYSVSVLGLIFQRFGGVRSAAQHAPLQKAGAWLAAEADS
jgi:type I restriction enzyme M protein